MKNIYIAMVMLGIVMFSFANVSALELNPFADKKIYEPILKEDISDFIKQDFNEQYGVIRFSKTLFWIETDKLAEYSLIENSEQCLINCEARGKATLYQDGKLFDDLNLLNKKGVLVSGNEKYLIKTFENYEVEVADTYKEVCQDILSNTTKGLIEKKCNEVVNTYKNETRQKEIWKEYQGETLKAGDYEWKVLASKKPTQSIDFIPTARGKALNEWAWWDGDWGFKKAINVSTAEMTWNNYTILLQIPYDSDMQADFDDLRFTNGAETTELGYWLNNKTDSTSAYVWVNTSLTQNANTTIYMYYGNAGASSNSNRANAFTLKTNYGAVASATIETQSGKVGLEVQPSKNVIISGFVKNSGSTDTTGYILNLAQATLTSVSYSGIWANFTNPYPLTSGTKYFLASDKGGASRGFKGDTSSPPLCTTSSFIYIAGGLNHNGGVLEDCVNWWHEVEEIWLSLDASPTIYFGVEEISEGVAVSLTAPINAYNSSSQTLDFNATITPSSADLINVTFRAGAIEETSALSGNETIVYNWTKTFADGDYSWNVTACGEGESTAILCSTTASRNFTIDSTAPSLTLNSPLTNFTTLNLPINVTLNFTATDSHLSSCWYGFNGANTTFTCNTAPIINVTTSGAHSIQYYSNDTFGNFASGTAPFYIYYVQANATATSPITEGGFSTFTLFVNMTDITAFNTSANLVWNGTNQGLGTQTNISNNSIRFDKTIIVPSINGTSANWTWFYNISGNPNVTNFNVSGSQTYVKINITECGAGTYQILNYTLYDQDTRTLGSTANASIEVDLILTSQANESLNWTFHATKSSATEFLICLPSGALNNSNYTLDSISKYSYQDHVIQYHYIVNFNLTNASIPQNIKLYDLATAKSTSFLINYQDENYLYVEDSIVDVWRRYIGDGVFFSVEHGKTDAQGQTRLHLVTEDIIYKFLVWKDGELLYTSPEYLALCQATPCQINLRKTIDETGGLSERDNLLYDYTFNKTTRTATFTFSTRDNTETAINMTILSSNQYENETACSTTLTTSGGQIDCLIPTAFANTSYQTIITRDGEYFGTAFDSLSPRADEIFGYTGIILTAIAYLMLALMGISSGIATIIFGIIGLVFMGIIQVFESGNVFGMASAIIWLIVAGVIIIIKITKRRIS